MPGSRSSDPILDERVSRRRFDRGRIANMGPCDKKSPIGEREMQRMHEGRVSSLTYSERIGSLRFWTHLAGRGPAVAVDLYYSKTDKDEH